VLHCKASRPCAAGKPAVLAGSHPSVDARWNRGSNGASERRCEPASPLCLSAVALGVGGLLDPAAGPRTGPIVFEPQHLSDDGVIRKLVAPDRPMPLDTRQ